MVQRLAAHQTAEYEIRVQGRVQESWSEWFDGLTISHKDESGEALITIFVGPIKDQAALYGLLNKIRDMNLPLLLVLCRSTLQKQTEKGRLQS